MDVNNREHLNGWLFCKTREWSNEEEIRVLVPPGFACKAPIEPRWLTRVILSWKMRDADRAQISEWAKQRHPELPVVNASYDQLDHVLKLSR